MENIELTEQMVQTKPKPKPKDQVKEYEVIQISELTSGERRKRLLKNNSNKKKEAEQNLTEREYQISKGKERANSFKKLKRKIQKASRKANRPDDNARKSREKVKREKGKKILRINFLNKKENCKIK